MEGGLNTAHEMSHSTSYSTAHSWNHSPLCHGGRKKKKYLQEQRMDGYLLKETNFSFLLKGFWGLLLSGPANASRRSSFLVAITTGSGMLRLRAHSFYQTTSGCQKRSGSKRTKRSWNLNLSIYRSTFHYCLHVHKIVDKLYLLCSCEWWRKICKKTTINIHWTYNERFGGGGVCPRKHNNRKDK